MRILSLGSLGAVEEGTVEKVEVKVTEQERARLQRVEARPPLSEILNLHDFEVRYRLRYPSRGYLTPIQGDCETHNAREGVGILFFSLG
jgi:hypothetical protein